MYKPLGFKKPLILAVIISFFLAFLFYVVSNAIPLYYSDGYKKLPQVFQNEDTLIKYIIPDKKYTYWALCDNSYKKIIKYDFGEKPKDLVFKPPSFFSDLFESLPVRCTKYIVYIDSGKVYYIEDDKKLRSFIGTVDNLQEAVLLARIMRRLYVDDDIRGGAYKIDKDTVYNLRLMRYFSCPETKQSVSIKIEKNKGILDTTTLSTYYKSKTCIIY